MEKGTSRKKGNRLPVLIVAVFFSFSLFIYGPIELYLTNINEFWFDLSQFWFICVGLCVLVTVILYIIGCKIPLWVQNIYVGAIFGFSLLMYIQSNFLNLDLGVMNGGTVDWGTYRIDFIINFAIWILVICVCICLYNEKNLWVKKLVKYLAVCITLIQATTMMVLLLTTKSDIDKSEVSYYVSDKGIYELSTDENIVVFLLDMFDDRYFKELLKAEPELAKSYEGFTFYENSTGNYSTTAYSIATLLTGQYLTNSEETFYEELTKLYDNCETFDKLLADNYQLDLYTYSYLMPNKLREKSNNYISGGKRVSDYIEFTKTIYSLTFSKYLPDFMKQYTWLVGTEFDALCERSGEADSHSVDNVNFYENLLDKGITVQNEKNCFKFIHLDATHYPYRLNENAERVETDAETSEMRCARGVLKIVQEYIDKMKENGVYDNSSIILMADHGYYWDGTLCNPILLVKEANATGEMKISSAPVSHHDFHPSILKMAGLNDNQEEGKAFSDIGETEDRERLFYQYYLKEKGVGEIRRLIEYSIDSTSNERASYHLTGNEYTIEGELINHFDSCEYCKTIGEQEEPNDNTATIVHS